MFSLLKLRVQSLEIQVRASWTLRSVLPQPLAKAHLEPILDLLETWIQVSWNLIHSLLETNSRAFTKVKTKHLSQSKSKPSENPHGNLRPQAKDPQSLTHQQQQTAASMMNTTYYVAGGRCREGEACSTPLLCASPNPFFPTFITTFPFPFYPSLPAFLHFPHPALFPYSSSSLKFHQSSSC